VKEISLHILDLIENAAEAGARRVSVLVVEDPEKDKLRISVSDDGRGMRPELLKTALDPFTTTRKTRKVGMGLALLAGTAQQAGGKLVVWSELGKGTRVRAEMQLSHLDRAPLGRVADTLASAAVLHPQVDLRFRHRGPTGSYGIAVQRLSGRGDPVAIRGEIRSRVAEGRRRIGSVA